MIDQIAEAVLYEGYLLYPYRRAVKNTQRWMFGGLFPPAYTATAPGNESSVMQVQCLVKGETHSTVEITPRFLQLVNRRIGRLPQRAPASADVEEPDYTYVDRVTVWRQP